MKVQIKYKLLAKVSIMHSIFSYNFVFTNLKQFLLNNKVYNLYLTFK